MTFRSHLLAALAGLLLVAGCGGPDETSAPDAAASQAPSAPAATAKAAGDVNVYSGRHYDNDLVLFDEFTAETGVKVNLIEADGDSLIERMAQEGAQSPADVFMTADAGILWRADQRGLFQPLGDDEILSLVPENLRHPEGRWIALSKRARVIIYNREMGLPDGFANYADLADPAYGGTICVRPSRNVYNQSLLASIIANRGEAAAREWAAGVVANFARKPQGNDTAQIEAVAAGLCRFGIVNSYYLARFIETGDAEKDAIGEKIGVLFPNQETTGTHVNISGAGLAAHAPNAQNARALIAFLLRRDVQARFAGGNNEYPALPGVAAEGPITTLGEFRADDIAVAEFGAKQPLAIEIFDAVDWP